MHKRAPLLWLTRNGRCWYLGHSLILAGLVLRGPGRLATRTDSQTNRIRASPRLNSHTPICESTNTVFFSQAAAGRLASDCICLRKVGFFSRSRTYIDIRRFVFFVSTSASFSKFPVAVCPWGTGISSRPCGLRTSLNIEPSHNTNRLYLAIQELDKQTYVLWLRVSGLGFGIQGLGFGVRTEYSTVPQHKSVIRCDPRA